MKIKKKWFGRVLGAEWVGIKDEYIAIYRVSLSINSVYNIDNRLTEISAKKLEISAICWFGGDMSVWGDISPIISNLLPIFIKKFQKKNI